MTASIVSFAVYAIVVLGIGIGAARRPQSTVAEIHLADREHGIWTSSLSASASTESGFVLLGMVGMGYSVGANALWIVPAGVLGYALNWFVLAPKLRPKSESLNAVTIPELIASSTGGSTMSRVAAALAALLGFVFLLAYVTAQFSAAGKALSSQFDISYTRAVLIGTSIVALYALLGGFRAVSWTDNIQAVMMVFALVILPIVVISSIGGPSAMVDALRMIDPTLVSLTAGASGWSGTLMTILPWVMLGLAYPGQPHAVARLMAARDQSVFRGAAWISMVWYTVVYSGAVLLGMAARAGFAQLSSIAADPEKALPILAVEFLPGALAGITVAAIIAAIASTADSTLIADATTVVRDLRAAVKLPPAKMELHWMWLVIVVLAIVATFFALGESPVVFSLVLYAWSGLGASLGPTVLYCALVKSPRPLPALLGLIVGGGLAFLIQGHPLDLLIGFSASLLSIAVSHYVLAKAEGVPLVLTEAVNN